MWPCFVLFCFCVMSIALMYMLFHQFINRMNVESSEAVISQLHHRLDCLLRKTGEMEKDHNARVLELQEKNDRWDIIIIRDLKGIVQPKIKICHLFSSGAETHILQNTLCACVKQNKWICTGLELFLSSYSIIPRIIFILWLNPLK